MSNYFRNETKITLLQEAGFVLGPWTTYGWAGGCSDPGCCTQVDGRPVVGGPGIAEGASAKAISKAIDTHQGGLLRRSLALVGRGEHARSQEDWDEEVYDALSEEESREHLATERAFGFAPPALWSED